jgi:hypothetical protein
VVATKEAKGILRRLLGDKGFPDEEKATEAVKAKLGR